MSLAHRVLRPAFLLISLALVAIAAAPAFPQVRGDQAAFTRSMADRFAAAIPGSRVDVKGPLTLGLQVVGSDSQYQINLDRVWQFCARNANDCGALIDDFVSKNAAALRQFAASTSAPLDLSALRLVLRPEAYVINLWKQAGGPGADSEPIIGPFAGDVWWMLVVDSPVSVRAVTRHDFERNDLVYEVIMEQARGNVRALLPPLARSVVETGASGVGIIEGGFYASSRLLLHDDEWAKLASTLKGRLLVVAPEPGVLVYADAGVRNSREALQRIAEDYAKKSDRPLSLTMFQWTPKGWKAVKR